MGEIRKPLWAHRNVWVVAIRRQLTDFMSGLPEDEMLFESRKKAVMALDGLRAKGMDAELIPVPEMRRVLVDERRNIMGWE